MEVVEDVGGTPYISFKPNNAIPRDDSIWAKMNHLFMFDREEFMRHYHKRSYAESVCSMVKGRFDDSVWSKSDVGQINEV
jgi:transposase